MKVALIHYWFVGMRGGEKVIEALCDMFPEADIYCHVYDSNSASSIIKKHNVRTTLIQKLPKANRFYQSYLPLMPIALEQLDLNEYDLVISSESGPAKGVVVGPDTMHICYCHSPMRYVWDMYPQYYSSAGFFKKILMIPFIHYLKIWDRCSADRVDYYLANSKFVAKRIKKYYRRDSTVINPPVEISAFSIANNVSDYYLIVGQLVGYKRVELAVDAFNQSGRKLVIIGEGEQLRFLKEKAKSNIQILGKQPFDVIKSYYSSCKALIFPGIEDFGMVPIEAMASGRPVIAYRKGGALETVIDGVTGLFFDEQTEQSINNTIERFESMDTSFCPATIRKHSMQFDKKYFTCKIKKFINSCMQ